MDSSSDDEGVISHRRSSFKRILDSDDEADDRADEKLTEATEDFKLHLSDDEDNNRENILVSPSDYKDDSVSSSGRSNSDKHHGFPREAMEEDEDNSGNERGATSTASKIPAAPVVLETGDIMKKLNALADSDSDDEGDSKSLPKSCYKSGQSTSRDAFECDLDSKNTTPKERSSGKKNVASDKGRKSKLGPERKSKTKAKDVMLEIKAESQRQLRQSKIGLPYHVPKQRTLLDFLNRRKSSSPMPIKGSTEQLAAAWKQIEEREKEAEEFYKSESEHESDGEDEGKEEPGQSEAVVQATEQFEEETRKNKEIAQAAGEINESHDSSNITAASSGSNTISSENKNEAVAETESCPRNGSNLEPENVPEEIENLVESTETSLHDIEKSPLKHFNSDECEHNLQLDHDCVANSVLSTESQKEPASNSDSALRIGNTTLTPNPQDSQEISLHLSEPQGGDNNVCNETDSICLQSKNEVIKSTEDASVTINSESEKCTNQFDGKSSKQGDEWDKLDSAMKCLTDEDSDCEDIHAESRRSKMLVLTSAPRLSLKEAPNGFIDLDDFQHCSNQSRTPGVKGLIDRFMKHSASKKKASTAQTVELSVISSEKDTSGGVVDVKQESLKIVLAGDDDLRSENITPGARLKLLKSELNRQMRKQKEEEWQKKQEEMRNEEVFIGEKDDCGLLLDEEEEEEMTESETESEPEINDVREPKRKRKSNNMFADEEAEVEDDINKDGSEEEEDDDNDGDGDDDNDGDKEEEEGVDARERDGVENEGDTEDGIGCENGDIPENVGDSDSDEFTTNEIAVNGENSEGVDLDKSVQVNEMEENENDALKPGSLKRTTTSVSDLFASQSYEWRDEDDDFIPAAQPNGVSRDKPLTPINNKAKDSSMFFSPLSLSMSGRTPSFLNADHVSTPTKLSWTELQCQAGIKKLFSEPEPSSTQEKFDEVVGLFAGKFNDSQGGLSSLVNTSGHTESESDLMALCSGKFVTQVPQPEELEGDCARSSVSESQVLSQTQDVEPSQASTLPVEDSVDFSLKWDVDRKGNEESDENSKEAKDKFRLEIMSSDDEDSQIALKDKKKKKKNRKLEFSDDEDSPVKNDTEINSELSDLENDESDVPKKGNPKLFGVFTKPSKEILYDSDENEIEADDFFEKEAELSEEEDWHGSDDEDEKGLDQLEMDEADKEDIDHDAVREQLVKNHMQKMLDEDRRDVRILQEMLLEDGELHSEAGGRERQFRWRNVDSSGMGDDGRHSDEEQADHDEEEDDAEWRRKRHEREMFLKEQREKQKKENGEEDDELLQNSELLQLGKSILFKSRSSSIDMSAANEPQPPKLTSQNRLLSPDSKRPSMLLSKRGSFLSRGDSVLAKLAKLTGSAKENVLAGAKTGGNFVFTSISPPKKEMQSNEDFDSKSMKRKAVGLANPAEKKPCLAPSRKGSGLFDHL